MKSMNLIYLSDYQIAEGAKVLRLLVTRGQNGRN